MISYSFRWNDLTSDLSDRNWNDIIFQKSRHVNELFSSFFKQFNRIVNKNAPIKVLSQRKIKQRSKPWITEGIKTSIKVEKSYTIGNDLNRGRRRYRGSTVKSFTLKKLEIP